METIHVRLLDEGTDCWRPVEADEISSRVFRLARQSPVPEGESWEFQPGDTVLCESRELSRMHGSCCRSARTVIRPTPMRTPASTNNNAPSPEAPPLSRCVISSSRSPRRRAHPDFGFTALARNASSMSINSLQRSPPQVFSESNR